MVIIVNTDLGVDLPCLYSKQTAWARASKKIQTTRIKRNTCENTSNNAEGRCAGLSQKQPKEHSEGERKG
jgi:hypothetical protein